MVFLYFICTFADHTVIMSLKRQPGLNWITRYENYRQLAVAIIVYEYDQILIQKIIMFQTNKQTCLLSANQSREYIAPCISIIAVETATLLAGSGPEASIEDIKYGKNLTEDIDDQ